MFKERTGTAAIAAESLQRGRAPHQSCAPTAGARRTPAARGARGGGGGRGSGAGKARGRRGRALGGAHGRREAPACGDARGWRRALGSVRAVVGRFVREALPILDAVRWCASGKTEAPCGLAISCERGPFLAGERQ